MNLTNNPPRYWRKTEVEVEQKWEELPSYKKTSLTKLGSIESIEVCECPSCKWAMLSELHPQSIWRWSHLLLAGSDWVLKVQNIAEKQVESTLDNTKLWYQGPSYMVFRRCLCYPEKTECHVKEGIIPTIAFEGCKMEVNLPDDSKRFSHKIRWGTDTDLYNWAKEFPELEK